MNLPAYPLAHALGWTLLHFCWQGAAVALLLWCVLGTVGSASRLRYAASCIALGLLVALPLVTFARLAIEDYRFAALARAPVQVADIFVSAVGGSAGSPWTVRLSVALNHAMPLLLAAWFVGVCCLLVRLSFGLFAAYRLRASGSAVSADLQQVFSDLCTRIGIARVVRLLNSAHVEVPTVVGWLRPAVLLPVSCFSGLAPDQIEAILCHELAHIRRHDYLVSVLQSMVETLLFYHPAVWWVSKQVRRERECCCDEFAVRAGGNVLAYARALSFLEERRALVPQLALGANGGVLKMRIQRLLGRPETSATSQIASIAVLTIIALSALTFAARHVWAEARSSQSTSAGITEGGTAASSLHNAALGAAQTQDLSMELARIRDVHSQQAGLEARLEDLKNGQAKYSALLARAGQQPQISDEDRDRLEDAARRLTDSIDAWVDQFNREIDARNAAMDGFDSPEFQKQMADATAHINSSEIKKQLADAQAAIAKMKADDLPRQMAAAETLRRQLNSLEMRRQIEAAKAAMSQDRSAQLQKQAEASRAAIGKMNSPEFRARIDEMAKEYSQIAAQQNRRQMDDAVRAMLTNQAELDARLKAKSQLYARNEVPAGTEVPGQQPAPANQPNSARVSSGVMAGLIVSHENPVYPPIAKAAHVQGVVVLHATISKEGAVEKLTVISGPPMLVQSAIDAVQKWTYRPYLVNGQPVEVETTINVNYTFGEPDLSCTYYGKGVQHPGTCEEDKTTAGNYSCRANDDKTLVQPQIGCESKVKGLQEPQHSSLSSVGASSLHWSAAPSIQISPATDQAGETVRKIGDGISPPQVISQVEPEFTEEARAAKASGKVLVGLIVDQAGLPENVHAVHSDFVAKDESRLARIVAGMNAKAVDAVRQYHFKPAMEGGNPVPVSLNVEVNFQVF